MPFIAAQCSATWKIGKYLNQLMRPYVEKTLTETSFRDESDFIEKLNHYVYKQNRLRPTTVFCSMKITNFYTLDNHEKMINKVVFFLQDSLLSNKLERVAILTIKNLLYLFLTNNIFSCNSQIYKIVKGSPNTIPLTETLSNIYLYLWQRKILARLDRNNELFGR